MFNKAKIKKYTKHEQNRAERARRARPTRWVVNLRWCFMIDRCQLLTFVFYISVLSLSLCQTCLCHSLHHLHSPKQLWVYERRTSKRINHSSCDSHASSGKRQEHELMVIFILLMMIEYRRRDGENERIKRLNVEASKSCRIRRRHRGYLYWQHRFSQDSRRRQYR